jgi:hypothetical protein
MADPLLMDRMFQRIMRGLVETGRAPHYAELARALGIPVEEGRRLLHSPCGCARGLLSNIFDLV